MTAVIYLRVSTKEQAQNLSLGTQKRDCLAYCRQQGFGVDRIFEDAGESAKTTDRPEFQKLLAYCRANKARVQFVVCYNLSRFSRNTHDHAVIRALLLRLGIGVRSATEPLSDDAVGKLTANMLAAIAQFDNDAKAERTKAGMKAAIERGRWAWVAPLGYLNGNRRSGEPSLVLDPERAPIIRKVFESIAAGGLNEAEALRQALALGLRSRKGKRVGRQTFRSLIRNPIFKGILNAPHFELRGVRGDFEALIPETVFDRVQVNLMGREPGRRRDLKHTNFPLRRFAICDLCGRPLTGSAPKGRSRSYPYYHCRVCRGVSARKEVLEAQFLELLERLRPRPEFLALFREIVLKVWERRQAESGKARVALEGRLADLRRRESVVEEAFLYEHRIDRQTYHRQRDKLREDIALVEIELADLKLEELDVEGLLGFAETVLSDAGRLWLSADADHRQRLQWALFPEGLRFRDGRIGTGVTCFAFNNFGATDEAGAILASPEGIEPSSRP